MDADQITATLAQSRQQLMATQELQGNCLKLRVLASSLLQ